MSAGSSSSLTQEAANQLFHHGALLIFLELPQGSEFGIDYNSWEVGPKFKGIKMIPPGIHFVYYSAVNKEREAAPRTGFFHNFQPREVLVKKWDPKVEDISDDVITAEEQERFEDNRQNMDRYLGAYPYDSYKKWVSLTNHINPHLLERVQPENRKISAVAQFQSEKSTSQSRAAATAAAAAAAAANDDEPTPATDEDKLPVMNVVEGTQIRFTEIAKKTYPEGATPQEVTKYSLDHSHVLQGLLSTQFKGRETDILGELQFAFICFLIGQVFDGFDQWKKLMRLICMSDEALLTHAQLFQDFISTVHYQVHEIPEDFFVDITTQNNFLVTVLHSFFENLEGSSASQDLKDRAHRFLNHLQKKFKWDFSAAEEEDCPVVVE